MLYDFLFLAESINNKMLDEFFHVEIYSVPQTQTIQVPGVRAAPCPCPLYQTRHTSPEMTTLAPPTQSQWTNQKPRDPRLTNQNPQDPRSTNQKRGRLL